MNRDRLIEKRTNYELTRQQILAKSYDEDINTAVEKYRQDLVAKYESERQTNLNKIDHYLEVIDELIEDARLEEELQNKVEVSNEEVMTNAVDNT